MNQDFFQSTAWYAATTLTERLETLGKVQSESGGGEIKSELAQDRLRRWRSQPPFPNDSMFAQRLAADHLTEEELLHLLGEPLEAVAARCAAPPDWLVDLNQAFARSSDQELLPWPLTWEDRELVEFLEAFSPLIIQGRQRVREGARRLAQAWPDLPFDPETVEEILAPNLPARLRRMVARTLVLELHIARLQGLLQGDTSAERYQSFLQRIRQPDNALALLQDYPVLARQLLIRIDSWARVSLEFLEHLSADWQTIRDTFCPGSDPGKLLEVQGDAGDSHRGGRAVLIARFSSGFRVVYKPKSLAVDQHFQDLLIWLNERGDHPPLRSLKILDRVTYGWVEFASPGTCATTAEVQRFYQRQGAYLALLYALEATDFHSENLIAAGEHPVLIDLEALFHPRVEGVDLSKAEDAAGMINYSVLSVQMLPQRAWFAEGGAGVDVSGMGSAAGELTPQPMPLAEGIGTDEMHFTRKRVPMSGENNQPTLNGDMVSLTDYTEAIVEGFTTVYRLLMKHREELGADNGPLGRFADDEVRVIVRSTQTYSILLYESFHPDVLGNALDRDRLLDRLWISVEHSPWLARLVRFERADLLQGDIPMFTTRPGSRDLWSSTNERFADFFDESGMALVRRRIKQLGDEDLSRQLWIIRASLATVAMDKAPPPAPSYPLRPPETQASRERLLAAARAVADQLESRALRGRHDVSWISLRLMDNRHWAVMTLGADLYNGLSGVALFLAYLGNISGERRYTDLAQAAVKTLRHQAEQLKTYGFPIGGFEGWGGVVYALSHLGVLWDQPELLAEAEQIVSLLPALIDKDDFLDVIGGSAGCIGGLLSLHQVTESKAALETAICCGDHLLARSQPMPQGVAWPPHFAARAPLTGFSHGAAGMAWALLELAAVTGAERFRTTAVNALAYERSLFVPEVGNWRDLRLPEEEGAPTPDFFMSWCHGAPGIGLARLRALRHLDDPFIRDEINAALKTTAAQGFGRNHTLCHGDLGNLELLLEASEILPDQGWKAEVNRLAAIILESIDRDGWLCPIPMAVESPGLMTGLAGIGYGLLRLAEPARVPSVLTMAPPGGLPRTARRGLRKEDL